LWVLALGRTILNLTLMPKLSADAQPRSQPLVSVVIPARNEEAVIEQTVRALLAQDYPLLEAVVVDDRSTDRTRATILGIDDARLRLIEGEETPEGWLGKPWALEQGSRAARGEIIVFVDADIIYAPPTIRAAVAELERCGHSMIALLPYFESRGIGERIGMGMLAFTPAMIPVWFLNRVQWKRGGLGGGSGNVIRREALEAIGRFETLRDAVIDDVALAHSVRGSGRPTSMVRAEHLIRVRMYDGARGVIEGFTKNMFAAVGRSYTIAAILLVLLVLCHLAPYAWAVAGDRYAIATVVLISVTRAILFRATGYRLVDAVFLHPFTMLLWTYIILRSVWVTGVLRRVHWRGRVYDAARTRFGA